MEIQNHDLTVESQNRPTRAVPRSREFEELLIQLKVRVSERPFLYLAVAFTAGLVSRSFPVLLILSGIVRLLFLLLGPAIQLLGLLKVKELISASLERKGYGH
jgi:hypothetical protein